LVLKNTGRGNYMNRLVSKLIGYRLNEGTSAPTTDKSFSFALCKNSSGSHIASCPIGIVYCLLGEAKNVWSFTSVSHIHLHRCAHAQEQLRQMK
jgi:hypothetical protein